MGQENQQKHYFDSIETDEFVMPNKFEVEIRMPDNQVSYTILKMHKSSYVDLTKN